MKIHSRMPDILNNQVSKGRNSDYLFQIPYSTRQGNYTNPEDISAAKFYLVPKDTMKNIIKGHNQDFATTCAKALLRDPYDYEPSSSDIQSTLQNIAEEHGYDYDFDNYTNPRYNRHIIQTDTETLYFEQDKKTRDWSVRVEFDAMDFDDNDEVVYDEWRKTN